MPHDKTACATSRGGSDARRALPLPPVLEAQIAATYRQIDQLVYEPYGLTAADIQIVEDGTGA
jgi:hypothetical protein